MTEPLKEAIVGTSDEVPRLNPVTQERVTIAEVELHMVDLRSVIRGENCSPPPPSGPSSSSSSSFLFPLAPIEATELERIERICDLLDSVCYWAIEEGTTYVDDSSALAQADVPEAICACILSRRPRIIAAALHVAKHLVRHRQSASELARVAEEHCKPGPAEGEEGENNSDAQIVHGAAFLNMIAFVVQGNLAARDVVTAAVKTVAALACSGTAVHAEPFLCSAIISAVLSATEQHPGYTPLSVAAAEFFASLVQLPRDKNTDSEEEENEEEEEEAVPVAILVCHVGCIAEFMCGLLKEQRNHSAIQQAVVDFISRCAVYPQNRERLMQLGGYFLVMEVLPGDVYANPDIVHAAAAAVSSFVPMLDAYQRRSFVLLIRAMLMSRGELITQQVAMALLTTLLGVLEKEGTLRIAAPHHGAFGGAFEAYNMYPQPPGTACSNGPVEFRGGGALTDGHQAAHEKQKVQLSVCDAKEQLTSADTLSFIYVCCIPQLTMHAIDFYQQQLVEQYDHDDREEDEGESEEALGIKRLLHLAMGCLRKFGPGP